MTTLQDQLLKLLGWTKKAFASLTNQQQEPQTHAESTIDPRTRGRTTYPFPGSVHYECGTDHTDGYRVTTGWNEDGYWVARISGLSIGDVIGTHEWAQLGALQDLACSLASTVDAINATEDVA